MYVSSVARGHDFEMVWVCRYDFQGRMLTQPFIDSCSETIYRELKREMFLLIGLSSRAPAAPTGIAVD
jgi:hypothetical protein